MHFFPALPASTAIRTRASVFLDLVYSYSIRTDPLIMYAYQDSEDSPTRCFPVLGAEDWEKHLLDAMEGEYRWYALPDDLVVGEIYRLIKAHREEVCGTTDGCPYGKVGGSDRRGYGVIEHTEACKDRQEDRRDGEDAEHLKRTTHAIKQEIERDGMDAMMERHSLKPIAWVDRVEHVGAVRLVKVTCPHCDDFHRHPWIEDDDASEETKSLGTRAAPCSGGSGYEVMFRDGVTY